VDTPIADLVERMLADNFPHASVVMAARSMETVTSRVTPSSRDASRNVTQEMARVRSLNYRNRKKNQQVAKANDVANNVVIEPTPSRDASRSESTRDLLTSSSLLPEDPFEKDKKERKQEVVARARGTRLKAGEFLTQPFIVVALDLGIDRGRIASIWEEFVDYWSEVPGQRGCKIAWLGAWRNNLKRNHCKSPKPLTQHQIERENSRRILNDLDKFANGGSGGKADPGLLRFDSSDGPASIYGGVRGVADDLPPRGPAKGD
jgi:hypothetical protein